MKLLIINLKLFFNEIIDLIGVGLRFKFKLRLNKIMESFYKINENFHIIQIGANDGKSFDSLYSFLMIRNAKGVLIEPIKNYYEELKLNYVDKPDLILINRAVHNELKTVEIYRVNPKFQNKLPDWAKGIASLDVNHHRKSGIDKKYIIKETVLANSLMEILRAEYNYQLIDLLQIDVEGFDYEVLKMFDFSWQRPFLIKLEFCNLDAKEKKNTLKIFKKYKYKIFFEGNDLIGIRCRKKMLR